MDRDYSSRSGFRSAREVEMTDVTEMLQLWSKGDQEAFDRIVPIVYQELKRLAHARLRREDTGRTLNTTGLVHEAYTRLVDVNQVEWKNKAHFLAMASRTMRRVLIDQARKRAALKRDGGARASIAPDQLLVGDGEADRLLELDEALEGLENEHPRQSKVLELLYFGGLNQQDVGAVLGISQPTVSKDLRFARTWLARELRTD